MHHVERGRVPVLARAPRRTPSAAAVDVGVGASSAAGIGVHPARVERQAVQQRLTGLPGVAVRVVRPARSARRPTRRRRGPSRPRSGLGEPATAAWMVGDGAAGQGHARAPGRRLTVEPAGATSRRGHGVRERVRGRRRRSTDFSVTSVRPLLSRPCSPSGLRRGGVDVVGVEPAQLLGEQLVELAALERHRPVRLAGGGQRGQLPSERASVTSPCRVRQHHLGDAGAVGAPRGRPRY